MTGPTKRWPQYNAVDRACGDAKLAAGAQRLDHDVHVLAAPDDRVDRAGLDALGAPDALGFDDQCNLRRLVRATIPVVRPGRNVEQVRQGARARVAAWWTAVDIRFADCHRLSVRSAAGVATLAALGLRQQAIEAFGQVVHGRTAQSGAT
jgi:hypothetical protein